MGAATVVISDSAVTASIHFACANDVARSAVIATVAVTGTIPVAGTVAVTAIASVETSVTSG